MKQKIFIAIATLALTPQLTRAAIFDAADILRPGSNSIGILTEAVLSNPSSEGIELRAKQGINEMVNLQAILGTGSDNRKFRFGGQSTITFFPDADGQPGISLLAGALYLRRATYSALQISSGPMIHEIVSGPHGYPITLYLAMPWSIELHSGNYNTSLQLAFGANYELTEKRNWFANTEAGIALNRSESYVALGIGMRLGQATFLNTKKSSKNKESNEIEYKSEDFTE